MCRSKNYELAWAAGFFDGEGCTGLRKQRKWFRLDVRVGQKDPELLYRFQAAVGGGAIYCTTRRGELSYDWASSGRKAIQILEKLYPHLGTIKQQQITDALQKFNDTRKNLVGNTSNLPIYSGPLLDESN